MYGKLRFTWNCKDRLALYRLLLVGISLSLLSGCTIFEKHKTQSTFTTVVVDAGHGGHDSGASLHGILPEKVWTLEVARRLEQNLKRGGFRVIMTRSDDMFVPLDERVTISNRQQDAVFVSIHFNYSNKHAVHGIETYYTTPQSVSLARVIHSKILDIQGLKNHGVLLAHFRVIRNNRHPAILIEAGYLTNHAEATRFSSTAYLDVLAQKIYEGIVKYRGAAPAAAKATSTGTVY
jgi:N-acetylmuramoyl-L-alanine amidase